MMPAQVPLSQSIGEFKKIWICLDAVIRHHGLRTQSKDANSRPDFTVQANTFLRKTKLDVYCPGDLCPLNLKSTRPLDLLAQVQKNYRNAVFHSSRRDSLTDDVESVTRFLQEWFFPEMACRSELKLDGDVKQLVEGWLSGGKAVDEMLIFSCLCQEVEAMTETPFDRWHLELQFMPPIQELKAVSPVFDCWNDRKFVLEDSPSGDSTRGDLA